MNLLLLEICLLGVADQVSPTEPLFIIVSYTSITITVVPSKYSVTSLSVGEGVSDEQFSHVIIM